MKNLLRATAILLLIMVSGAMAASLVHSTDAQKVATTLKKLGYKVTLQSNGAGLPQIRIEDEGGRVFYLYMFDDDKRRAGYEGLQLLVSADPGGDVPADAINYWNQMHRYAKVYLDDSGAVCLESDLDLEMGVVLESALKEFVSKFLENLDAYELELIGK
ncbi:YbjN domain-containing protein [Oceanithermus sp.]